MPTRLKEFRILAGIYLALGLYLPLLASLQTRLFPEQTLLGFGELSPLHVSLMLLSLGCSLACYLESRLIVPLAGGFIALWTWNSLLSPHPESEISLIMAGLGSLGLILVHSLLLREGPLEVLKNPRLRWWMTPRRYEMGMRTWIHPVSGGDILARTYDISETGVFVPDHSVHWTNPSGTTIPNFVQIGTRCAIRLYFDSQRSIDFVAEVVRKAEASGRYPSGFALRFIEMAPTKRTALKRYIHESLDGGCGYDTSAA